MTLIGTLPIQQVKVGQPIMIDGRPYWFYGYAPAGDHPTAPLVLDVQARDADGWGWDCRFVVPTDYRAILSHRDDWKYGTFGDAVIFLTSEIE